MTSSSLSSGSGRSFTVRCGAAHLRLLRDPRGGLVLDVPMDHLAGPSVECLATSGTVREAGGLTLFETAETCWGVALGEPGEPPHEAARRLYAAVLEAAGERALSRVWAYVPAINEEKDGLENYRAFNAGRREAFAARFGTSMQPHLPAASALGVQGECMALVFCAAGVPEHFENPEQLPACHYPSEWGPAPPAFARGSRLVLVEGARWFLSGTASIKGHATCGGDFAAQFSLTLDNVRLMLDRLAVPDGVPGDWKIFLRNAADLAACEAAFHAAFPGRAPMILRTEICRSCLLVEVEATFHDRAAPTAAAPQSAASRATRR